ncbi:ABC transporter permease [Natronosalvus rutilus]|uniref:ABC transporter permease n=2 Tax=Natronosalvus rutilus TaxID=2953753 RepID=A0A9E7SY77_9EURY|nr:ABC transporter permease [Natronosalvus rutilus]
MGVSFFIVVTILFFLFRQVPGGPTAHLVATGVPQDVQERVIESYGLNEPLWKQYVLYITNVFQGDLGHSFYYNRPVIDIIGDRFYNTIILMMTAILLAYTVGTYIGAQLAWIRGSSMERKGMVAVLFFRSMPAFWTGILLLYIFAFQLELFPLGGVRGIDADYSTQLGKFLSVDFLHHLVLPVLSIAIFYVGFPILLMRSNMLEVLTETYIFTARAKGVAERRVMLSHAARNAILPIVTALGIEFGFAIGGQVLIETVFSWPGLGREMVDASLRNDYPLAQGTFILLSAMVISMNFMADLAYTYLDPRVELDQE